jgi:AraC family transcriptional regulator, regulatory protein of adaptative response / DNA-3-methyladenine glycosylase II
MSMPPPTVCDRARASKDARFDGLFFTAVRSTGIYCRPVCPAPTPKRRNIAYFPTAAAAAAAGYRPCLRCRPELSPGAHGPGGEETVQRALSLIADGALETGSIDGLAARVGVSGRQLRRLFLTRTGATPIVVHTTRRLLLAKQLLTETSLPVTEVAMAAGFGSLRRFNTAFREGCGMPPTAIRRLRADTPAGTLTLRLAYRPPLDFASMLAFLAKRAIPGLERVSATSYERVLGTAEQSTWIRVTADAARPELRLEISASEPAAIPDVVRRVRRMFDLDADLRAVHGVLGTNRVLARAVAKRPGLRIPGGWDGFEVAVRAVLGQQVTVAAATTLTARLVDRWGGRRPDAPAGLDRVFPTPDALRDAPLEEIGLPRSRAATLRSLAAAVAEGRLDLGRGQRLDEFVEKAVLLPGIGRWTAQYMALRALGHPDAFPAGDLVLQQVMGRGRRLSERETEIRSQAWRPWRAYAVLHLWHTANDRRTR